MSLEVPALVLAAPGINCHRETRDALNEAGAAAEVVHINQLLEGDRRLTDYGIFVLPGGFAHGDHLGAGRVLGLQLRMQLAEDITRLHAAGGLTVGICNGMQALVESGLLPDGVIDGTDRRTAAMDANRGTGEFYCGWTSLLVRRSVCSFMPEELEGRVIRLQVAHAEGQFKLKGVSEGERAPYRRLVDRGQVVFQYADKIGLPTEEFSDDSNVPGNPNGSPLGITAICDPSGQIFGGMPHIERSTEENPDPEHPPVGKLIMKGVVRAA